MLELIFRGQVSPSSLNPQLTRRYPLLPRKPPRQATHDEYARASVQGGKEEAAGGGSLPQRDEGAHLGNGDSRKEQRGVGAQTLPHDGRSRDSRETKPTTFETLTIAAVVGPKPEKRRALAQKNACQQRWICEAGRQQREVVRWGYRRMADLRVSTTDPDASPMQHKNKGTSRLGYQTQYVVDGGKARVILDVLVTPAEVPENLPMLDLLFRSRFRWHLHPRSVTARSE